MLVKIKFSALRDTHWHEYALRFGLGGLATVCTGLIAEAFGPAAGGLFLAFPAIFCASATLIEKHERDRKEKAGLPGKRRGQQAAALDAHGRRHWQLRATGLRGRHVDAAGPHGIPSGLRSRRPGLDSGVRLPVVGLAASSADHQSEVMRFNSLRPRAGRRRSPRRESYSAS